MIVPIFSLPRRISWTQSRGINNPPKLYVMVLSFLNGIFVGNSCEITEKFLYSCAGKQVHCLRGILISILLLTNSPLFYPVSLSLGPI